MEEEGFEPDLATYNMLVNSYCKKSMVEDTFYLYKIMYIKGVIPNLIIHTALMNGLYGEGEISESSSTSSSDGSQRDRSRHCFNLELSLRLSSI
ncbi:Pentatricopeptide repeat-containing protein [Spatholobus suberectus]|nr:Pentatricopeptide repeat-containing protein [Spatholobus suberectus]